MEQEITINLPYNWTPRIDQMPLWSYLENGGLRAAEIAHRRWGKDEVALRWTSVAMHKRIGNYWHMLPQYSQGRKAIWESINPKTGKYRVDEAFPEAIRASTRNTDMVIQAKCGSQWQLVGSDNYNSIVGSPPIGIVFSEWSLADPLAWAYLEPILEENGGWALFITSSRGNNHAIRTYNYGRTEPGWFAQILKATESGVFSAEQLEKIERGMIAQFGDDLGRTIFAQEYMCSIEGAILGAYYAKQMELLWKNNRITNVPHRPDLEVFTAWDLGVDDSMSIWFFQQVGKSFQFIDYYENTGFGMGHYSQVLKDKNYNYGGHYWPHDADQREIGSEEIAKSPKENAENLGIHPITVVKRAKNIEVIVKVHIPAARNILSQCWFDKDNCMKGISALEGYHTEYNEDTKVLGGRPAHDWTSHAADAFRTFAVGYEGQVAPIKTSKILEILKRGASSIESSGNNIWSGL